MKSVKLFLFIVLLLAPVANALVETDVVFDLDGAITHLYQYEDFFDYYNVTEHLTVPIPDANLLPGEIYRVNIRFVNDEALKIVNGAQYLEFYSRFRTGDTTGGSPKSNDGLISNDITSSRDIGNTAYSGTTSCLLSSQGDYQFLESFSINRADGDIIDGSILQRFTVEFTSPTTLDGSAFTEQAYTNNNVSLSLGLTDAPGDVNLLEVIPCLNQPHADLNVDCKVDMLDLAMLMSEWLNCGLDNQDLCWP